MLISFGTEDKVLYEGYIGNTPCNSCQHLEQNYVTIWAKSFRFGPWIFPIRWATWDKNAGVTCNNCHKSLNISETQGELKTKMLRLMREYPLWKQNIPLILIGGYFSLQILIAFLSLIFSHIIGTTLKSTSVGDENYNKSVQSTSQEPKINTLTPDSLYGSWIVTSVKFNSDEPLGDMESKVAKMIQEEDELSILLFLKDSTFVNIREGHFIKGNWTLYKDSLVTKKLMCNRTNFGNLKYQNPGINNHTMYLETLQFLNAKSTNTDFELIRFKLGKDELKFIEYADKLFTMPQKQETDSEIKERMKSSLLYYSLYFQVANKSGIAAFNPESIYLPIKFYNGGIGLDEFSEKKIWKDNYSNSKDAQKAYHYLEKALEKIDKYPSRENIALEYAEVLRNLAEKL
jgi:hypothetical protein